MKQQSNLTRGILACVLAGLIGTAAAADDGISTTTIKVIGDEGAAETLRYEGSLAVGESRGLYTDAGTPITVQRNEDGLNIQLGDRTIDVPFGDAIINTEDADDGSKRIIVLKRTDGDGTAIDSSDAAQIKRVIVMKRGADGALAIEDGELAALAELGELKHLDGLAEGKQADKIVVIRRVEKTASNETVPH